MSYEDIVAALEREIMRLQAERDRLRGEVGDEELAAVRAAASRFAVRAAARAAEGEWQLQRILASAGSEGAE